MASESLPNVLSAVQPLLPVWPENLPDPTLLLGIRPSHQSTARYRAAEWSCGVAAFVLPLFIVLMEFKPSPFSFIPFLFSPCGYFQFSTLSPAAFGEGCFPRVLHSAPQSPSSLRPQKWFPTLRCFSLPKFTIPRRIPAEFCGSGCADCCVNSPISFLGV